MDIESKKFLGQPKNFVSIFNALLFDGQPVLKPEYLKDENSELVMNVSSKHVDTVSYTHLRCQQIHLKTSMKFLKKQKQN